MPVVRKRSKAIPYGNLLESGGRIQPSGIFVRLVSAFLKRFIAAAPQEYSVVLLPALGMTGLKGHLEA